MLIKSYLLNILGSIQDIGLLIGLERLKRWPWTREKKQMDLELSDLVSLEPS